MEFHRDFLYMQHSRRLPDGTYVVASRSAGVLQDNTLVAVPGAVGRTLHASGYVIRPLNDDLGTCEVTYVVHGDLGGHVPAAIVNRVSEDQPQRIHLRERLLYAELYGGGSKRDGPTIVLTATRRIIGREADGQDGILPPRGTHYWQYRTPPRVVIGARKGSFL